MWRPCQVCEVLWAARRAERRTQFRAGVQVLHHTGQLGDGGAEGVEVEQTSGARYRLQASEARRVHGHLVIDLEVAALNDRAQEVGVLFLSGLWEGRPGTRGVVNTAAGVFVVRGGTAIYPLDHLNRMTSSGEEQRLPATDLETRGDIAPGATRTFSIIYPDIGDVGEVTIQSRGALRSTPFRLTDIPVR